MASPIVAAVSISPVHGFSKEVRDVVRLVAGLGVEGDAHAGPTVQHLSQVRRDPDRLNLRQVHLIAGELLEELAGAGHPVQPGRLGENITTAGVDLFGPPGRGPGSRQGRCGGASSRGDGGRTTVRRGARG